MLLLFMLFTAALALTLTLTPIFINLLRRSRVMDIPNQRSSHRTPIPRGGGLGILFPLVMGIMALEATGTVSTGVFGHGLLAGVVGMMLIGFLDDIYSLSALVRLAIEGLLAAVCLAVMGLPLHELALPFLPVLEFGPVGWILAWLFVVGFANMFNFMDGINGLAGFQTLIACAGLALVAHVVGRDALACFCALMAGGALGFLRYNFPAARIFMGDVGSLPLGFFLACMVLSLGAPVESESIPIVVPLLLIWPVLFDATLTLLIRMYRHQSLHHAHRDHIYQRLLRTGHTHTQVTLRYLIAMILSALAAWIYKDAGDPLRAAILVVVPAVSLWFSWIVIRNCRAYNNVSSRERAANG